MNASLEIEAQALSDLETAVMARSGKLEGASEIRFCCVAHDDRNPSARYNREKKVWICDACHTSGGFWDLFKRLNLEKPLTVIAAPRKLVATYDYTNAQGAPLFQVLRYEPKSFAQRRPEGTGWAWNLEGVQRVLYKLHDVLAVASAGWRVYVVEGEKDADALEAIGLCGTTSPHGAGKWRNEYADSLAGAQVVIVPDNDEPGRRHAEQVAQSCYGKAKSVRVLTLPNEAAKDLSDWLSLGGTKAELERLADETPEWRPAPAVLDRSRALSGADFLAVEVPPQRMLVAGHVPERAIGYIVGLPKAFKSFYALELAFSIAAGSAFLGRFEPAEMMRGKRVLVVQTESAWSAFAYRVRQIAERYGGMPEGLFFLSNVPITLEDPASRERITAELERIRPDLLILDPLAAMTIGDENSATEMGTVVRTLRGWRDTYDCGVFVVHHANKASQGSGGRAGLKMRGSSALYASSEATISIERPNDDETRVHVAVELKDGEAPKPYACEFSGVGCELRMTSESIHHTVTDDTILEAIKARKGEASQQQLGADLGITARQVRERMKPLQGKKVWTKPGTGVGTPVIYVTKPA